MTAEVNITLISFRLNTGDFFDGNLSNIREEDVKAISLFLKRNPRSRRIFIAMHLYGTRAGEYSFRACEER